MGELVTDNRLKINLDYRNYMNCYVTLSLPESKNLKLTIDNFYSESGCCDYFYVYDGTYDSKTNSSLRTYNGRVGSINYQWYGNAATFHWHTDSSNSYSPMIAYVDF